jgi:YHS domain-containing protein
MSRIALVLTLAALVTLVACKAHDHGAGHGEGAHDAAKEMDHHKAEAMAPDSMPASAPANVLPNDGTRKVGDLTKCPVSGKTFTIAADSASAEHEGGTYYVCCAGCVDKFSADPAGYLAKATEAPEVSDANVLPNDGTRQVGDVTKCPTSGETFTVKADSPKYEADGKTVWFCCEGCIDKYKATL